MHPLSASLPYLHFGERSPFTDRTSFVTKQAKKTNSALGNLQPLRRDSTTLQLAVLSEVRIYENAVLKMCSFSNSCHLRRHSLPLIWN